MLHPIFCIGYDFWEQRIVLSMIDNPRVIINSWKISEFKTWKELDGFLEVMWMFLNGIITDEQYKLLGSYMLQYFPFNEGTTVYLINEDLWDEICG